MTAATWKTCRSKIAYMAVAFLALAAIHPGPAFSADVFAALDGAWSGTGNAVFESGAREPLRCSAVYRRSVENLKLTLKCASPSANITLSGTLSSTGANVAGTWTESAFNLSGAARGTASTGAIRLQISGGAEGTLTLLQAGASHSVAFTTKGAALRAVNVSLRRR